MSPSPAATAFEAMRPAEGLQGTSLPGPKNHIPALDGLRGLAVLLVVVFHIFQVESIPSSTLPRLLHLTTRLGQTGVDLFFVLSGFLITGILIDTKDGPRFFRNFYGRRTLRIFPLYYGVLIVTLVVIPRVFGIDAPRVPAIWLWTYTANLPMSVGVDGGILGHFWTLAIEEQFYLLWPVIVFAVGRQTLIRICLLGIVVAAVLRMLVESVGVSSFTLTFCRMDSLLLGGFLALAARSPQGVRGWRNAAIVIGLATMLIMLPLYVLKTGSGDHWVQVVKYTVIAIFHGAVLTSAIAAPSGSWTNRLFTLGPLLSLGRYSYGMYIYHPFVIQFIGMRLTASRLGAIGISPTGTFWLRLASILTLSFGVSWLSWHLFESHWLKLKRYFAYRDDAGPKALSAPFGVRRPLPLAASVLQVR